jgi:hypothetical protein
MIEERAMPDTVEDPAPTMRVLNGVLVPLTPDEIAARAAEEAAAVVAPLRWEVPKLLVLQRLAAAGKLRLAITALRREAPADDLTDAELTLREMWDAAVAISSDDAVAAAFFMGIGADPAAILARP